MGNLGSRYPRPGTRYVLSKNAFTLIEIAVVLIVIGLVVGGILVGRDLIKSSEIRSQIKQFQDYQVAFVTFQGKYGCIPGDCTNATTFFGTTFPSGNSVVNGNGNGLVDTAAGTCFNNSSTWADNVEMWSAFEQMAFTKLIDFSPSTLSLTAIHKSLPLTRMGQSNSGFFIGANYNFSCSPVDPRTPDMSTYRRGENALWFAACQDSMTYMGNIDNECGIFLPGDLMAIDQKIDDGRPLSGKLLGFGGFHDTGLDVDDAHVSCTTGLASANAYNVSRTTPQCQAAYIVN